MTAISDDNEDIETVRRYVQKFHETTISSGQASRALGELVQDGLAQAYLLSPQPPHATKVGFDPNRIDELWFYVTPEGKKFVQELNKQARETVRLNGKSGARQGETD